MSTEHTTRRIVCRTRTRRNRDFGEYQVLAYDQGGCRFPEADYFTDCRDDARETAMAMVNDSRAVPTEDNPYDLSPVEQRYVALVVDCYRARYEKHWQDRLLLALENAADSYDCLDSQAALVAVCDQLGLHADNVFELIYA